MRDGKTAGRSPSAARTLQCVPISVPLILWFREKKARLGGWGAGELGGRHVGGEKGWGHQGRVAVRGVAVRGGGGLGELSVRGGPRRREGRGGLRRHTPPLAGGRAREEPPPPLGVACSPRFPSARLAWQPPRRRAPRPARGGPPAQPVGSRLTLRPGDRSPPSRR